MTNCTIFPYLAMTHTSSEGTLFTGKLSTQTVEDLEEMFRQGQHDILFLYYICSKLPLKMAKIGINITTGSLQQEEMIVGIDLGTTNSLVAIIHPESKQPVALKEHGSSSLVPSIVHFDEAGNVTVGEEAKNLLVTEPQNTIFSAKRLMGKSYNDIRENASVFTYKVIDDDTESLVKVQVGDRFYSPIDLSSFILKELKQRAEHILKTPVTK